MTHSGPQGRAKNPTPARYVTQPDSPAATWYVFRWSRRGIGKLKRRELVTLLGGAFLRLDISANKREAMPVLMDSVVWPLMREE